ncbi:26982_t:CDS:1, partial [Dentiscutata erythropus]
YVEMYELNHGYQKGTNIKKKEHKAFTQQRTAEMNYTELECKNRTVKDDSYLDWSEEFVYNNDEDGTNDLGQH